MDYVSIFSSVFLSVVVVLDNFGNDNRGCDIYEFKTMCMCLHVKYIHTHANTIYVRDSMCVCGRGEGGGVFGCYFERKR